ncbi:endonuclease/exonuclease/phosphatase family protein [Flavobacterium capsici]|uniref:Endonuclease/exonuclease/phosphatase family protein n=1 Tax=Flavobacterium capsici TaxID=3075618 RepID=A0AA96EZ67_9FLAO|nr:MULTISPECIES: endonuclease/exonuclease/phosphatase family protein [unclassified Flavobacterium]WNM19585.1 endonuclease/exonuclease/phosphatase family protein [Flavobacterium sp. PMR2A8]WNM20974.1 endonuclease/exonuclease/phosphatase family protein [Flavobacterium sp. PMTSA4]
MRIKKLIAVFFGLFAIMSANGQTKKYNIHTVAFYNLENLFDTINGPNNDEEWLPNGAMSWTGAKYKQKLHNLARVISEIGTSENPNNSPTLLGCCEIENRGVLEDLVKEPLLINKDYGIVHFDSPDKRGIDVGFLYQKKHFKPTSYRNIPLIIYKNQEGKGDKKDKEEATDDVTTTNSDERVYTRDQLLVTGYLDGEEVNIIVNHWPSRSGGEKKSSPFREAAGRLNRKIIDSLIAINPNAKIITMGDLNDGTYNKSVKEGIGAKRKKEELKSSSDIYNPFEEMFYKGNASLFWRDSGDIFDQIMISEAFTRKDYSSFRYWKAGIYNKPYMIQTSGQYKGYPLRNSNAAPGFSDHFPVFIYLLKEIK